MSNDPSIPFGVAVDPAYDSLPAVRAEGRWAAVPESVLPGASTRPLDSPGIPQGRLALSLPDGGELRLERRIAIGQSRANDVVLRDPWVSRRHCIIEPLAHGVVVRDVGSTNGTWVNGLRVDAADLKPGALLSVGRQRLRVAPAGVDGSPLLGDSPPMRELRRAIERLAASPLPVLVTGETGTGKELVALALHRQSGRSGAFVPVNCGSIPRELVESELFGHERGAFTGASAPRSGLFREADGGTLFLDEVGELPPSLQTRLLRALETGSVRPIGAAREVMLDVRVVAATHVELHAAARIGRFREDLYYRLAGAVLCTPPLRARPEDVPLLARHLLSEIGGGCTLTENALSSLSAHSWPGNVRELKNVLRRAAVFGGPAIDTSDLELPAPGPHSPSAGGDVLRVDGRKFIELEREILAQALRRSGGRLRAAAAALGLPKSTLSDKARRYGLLDP